MSIWSDIHKRSNGHAVRKEDTVNENSWDSSYPIWEYNPKREYKSDVLKEHLNKLKTANITLTKKLDELKREIDKFKWIK